MKRCRLAVGCDIPVKITREELDAVFRVDRQAFAAYRKKQLEVSRRPAKNIGKIVGRKP